MTEQRENSSCYLQELWFQIKLETDVGGSGSKANMDMKFDNQSQKSPAFPFENVSLQIKSSLNLELAAYSRTMEEPIEHVSRISEFLGIFHETTNNQST
jgi:hypothetical protein